MCSGPETAEEWWCEPSPEKPAPLESERAEERVARRRPERLAEAGQVQVLGKVRTWGFILGLKEGSNRI